MQRALFFFLHDRPRVILSPSITSELRTGISLFAVVLLPVVKPPGAACRAASRSFRAIFCSRRAASYFCRRIFRSNSFKRCKLLDDKRSAALAFASGTACSEGVVTTGGALRPRTVSLRHLTAFRRIWFFSLISTVLRALRVVFRSSSSSSITLRAFRVSLICRSAWSPSVPGEAVTDVVALDPFLRRLFSSARGLAFSLSNS